MMTLSEVPSESIGYIAVKKKPKTLLLLVLIYLKTKIIYLKNL